MSITTTTTTITDHQAVLDRSRDALAGLRAHIAATEGRIQGYHNELDQLDQQEAAQHQLVRKSEEAIEEAEATLRRARMSALISQGTSTESSTSAAAMNAESELATLREKLSTAKTEQTKLVKQLAKQRESLQKKIESDMGELQSLSQQADELASIEKENHQQLGHATYDALVREIALARETEQNLATALDECKAELSSLQDSVSVQLRAWPDLRKQLQQELDVQVEISPASVRVARAAKAYLLSLSSWGQELEPSRNFQLSSVFQLLAIDASAIQRARQPGFSDLAEQRIRQLEDYARQIEQQANERRRSVASYGW